jgi:type II secretory pathway component PulJ
MATMPTSRPGKSDGYVLLDALLATLLAAIISSAVLPGLALAARRSAEHFERTIGRVAERSERERGEALGGRQADGREAR